MMSPRTVTVEVYDLDDESKVLHSFTFRAPNRQEFRMFLSGINEKDYGESFDALYDLASECVVDDREALQRYMDAYPSSISMFGQAVKSLTENANAGMRLKK